MAADHLRAFADDLAHDPFMRDHVGLVLTCAQSFLRPYDDERKADGAKLAVSMALRGYKPDRAKFSTYLYGAFRWARVDEARRFRLELRETSGRRSLDAIESFDLPARAENHDARIDAESALAKLKPRSRDIVRRVVMLGEPRSVVARAHKISRERVRQIVAASLEILRK